MTCQWTASAAAAADPARAATVPLVDRIDRQGLPHGWLYWDLWPIQDQHGRIARPAGRELWMVLAAPDRGNPALRHFDARIHLLERAGGQWHDLGRVLDDAPVPYEREWAGSAVTDGHRVTLHFTGAGIAARPGGYQQMLVESSAAIGPDGLPRGWTSPRPSITGFHPAYMPADAHAGEPGQIKAFRDPAWFRDPADGAEYLVFTASLAGAATAFNGAIGLARRHADGWHLLPPIIHADGVNNELERAHVVFHDGRYFAFWATQSSTFAPALRHAPGGLYGMVANRLAGPWRPLNGSGLVLCNPPAAPQQSYSWFVSSDLVVASFVDLLPAGTPPLRPDAPVFGGVPAPLLHLRILADRIDLVQSVPA
jgi:levansucrase